MDQRSFCLIHYNNVIKGLLSWGGSVLIARMSSKITLGLGTALAAIALCCFVESSFSQDALVASLDAMENDDRDTEDKDDRDNKSCRPRTRTTGSLTSRSMTWSGDNLSLGLTSVGAAAEVETVVVTGSPFDLYPVPYPALPPVEGTITGSRTDSARPIATTILTTVARVLCGM
jgi:hypothetical protein